MLMLEKIALIVRHLTEFFIIFDNNIISNTVTITDRGLKVGLRRNNDFRLI